MQAVMNDALDEYVELVRAFPLVSIHSSEQLESALRVIDRLLEKPERSIAENLYLDALTDLVEVYETASVTIPTISGVAALHHLMEENGLSQGDIVPLLGTRSIVSEVMSGKRRLSLSHIRRLAAYFHVPADVFIELPSNS